MENIVVDSDILIDLIIEVPEVVNQIKQLEVENTLGTTDINVFELYRGTYKSHKKESELAAIKGVLNTSLPQAQIKIRWKWQQKS